MCWPLGACLKWILTTVSKSTFLGYHAAFFSRIFKQMAFFFDIQFLLLSKHECVGDWKLPRDHGVITVYDNQTVQKNVKLLTKNKMILHANGQCTYEYFSNADHVIKTVWTISVQSGTLTWNDGDVWHRLVQIDAFI